MNYNVKLICGFRRDQEHTIDAEEAHKAYYLFLHPEARGIFKNGLAIIGADIKEIVPDWHTTMGWNPTHVLDSDDWNEMRQKGIDRKLHALLSTAREIANFADPTDISMSLSQLIETKYPQLQSASEHRQGKMLSIGELRKPVV